MGEIAFSVDDAYESNRQHSIEAEVEAEAEAAAQT